MRFFLIAILFAVMITASCTHNIETEKDEDLYAAVPDEANKKAVPVAAIDPNSHPVLVVLPQKSAQDLENLGKQLQNHGAVIREKAGNQVLVIEHDKLNPAWINIPGVRIITNPDWSNPLWKSIDGAYGLQTVWSRYSAKIKTPFAKAETIKRIDGSEKFELSAASGETWGMRGHGHEKVINWRTPEDLRLMAAYQPAPGFTDTSLFLIGNIAVGVVFVDGATAKWQDAWKTTALKKIQAGASWYIGYKPQARLNFTVASYSVTVSTNPTESSFSDSTWLYEALQNLGYSPNLNGAYEFNNALRNTFSTDWAYLVFIVTDGVLGNGTKFADGYFAFAYYNGPLQVHTDDNNGYGIGTLDNVFAHETGHTFGAGDEYCAPGYACCSCYGNYGYLGIENLNCAAGCPTGSCGGGEPNCEGCSSCMQINCLMRNNVWDLCSYSQHQLGWLDSDGDGIFDPVDTVPAVTLTPYTPDPSSNPHPGYSGTAVEPISQIALVEYSVSGCATIDWTAASADDGLFSKASEPFFFSPQLAPGSCTISVRAKNRWGNYSKTVSDTLVVDCGSGCKCDPGWSGSLCEISTCGDSIIVFGEQCDDGNTIDGDGCDSNCQKTGCGNGVITAGELCDDGNSVNTDSCKNDCTLNVCGDQVVFVGKEDCDDGNTNNKDACKNDCTANTCGDGIIRTGVEQCDLGAENGGVCSSCTAECTIKSSKKCGDGNLCGSEECDLGANNGNCSTCTAACTIKPENTCGDGFVCELELCDDGNTNSNDSCKNDCTPNTCGDGVVWTGVEKCDDGNTSNNDACKNDCTPNICGDGVVLTGVEDCDDGNTDNNDACRNDCTLVKSKSGGCTVIF